MSCKNEHWKKGIEGLAEQRECRDCTPRCVICDKLPLEAPLRTYGVVCDTCYALDMARRGRSGEPDRRVIEAVIVRYSERGVKLEDVQWGAFGGNWHFDMCGMYVGVEPDGYTHT